MVSKDNNKGVSLMTLIITVIVAIILATITVVINSQPTNQAMLAKFLQEITDIKTKVDEKIAYNNMNGFTGDSQYTGFKKVTIVGQPNGFESFDDVSGGYATAYLVDLKMIDYEKLSTGQEYKRINENAVISFNNYDVYVFDKNGIVYYVKGITIGDQETIYTAADIEQYGGPEIEAIDNGSYTVKVKVTPKGGSGDISSVVLKDSAKGTEVECIDSGDGLYFFKVESSGRYIASATQAGIGTSIAEVIVRDEWNYGDNNKEDPNGSIISIGSGNTYTNVKNVSLLLNTNAELMYIKIVTDGSLPIPPLASDDNWITASNSHDITLFEGKNEVYVWFRNEGNPKFKEDSKEIILDTKNPNTDMPKVELNGDELIVTARQKDPRFSSGIRDVYYTYGINEDDPHLSEWQAMQDLLSDGNYMGGVKVGTSNLQNMTNYRIYRKDKNDRQCR